MQSLSHSSVLANLQLFFNGLEANVPADLTLLLNGKTHTRDAANAVVAKRIEAVQAVINAHAALSGAVQALKATNAETELLFTSLKAAALAMFRTNPEVLGQLGLAARKPAPKPTAEQLLERTLKRAATRAARHTKGAKQKAKIKGTAGTIVVVPPSVAEPSAPL